MKVVTIKIPDDLHKRFKLYSVINDKKMNELIIELITEKLERSKANATND